MSVLNFDAATVPPSESLDPIPAGWYTAIIDKSEMKPTSTPGGQYLQLELAVIDGPYAGRKVFDRLNIVNANQVAQEIAYKTLSAICHAVRVLQVRDSQELHGKPLQVKVSLRPAGPGADGKHYDASNEVKGYKASEQGATVAPPAPAWTPPAPPAAPAWTPPSPAQPPAWTPPPAAPVAPPALALRVFVCNHCHKLVNDYQAPTACSVCGCPNSTQFENMQAAQAFVNENTAPATPPQTAPVAPPAPPADADVPPWMRGVPTA